MTAYIQKVHNEYADDYLFAAYLGFKAIGSTVKPFHNLEDIHYKPNDVVVGSLDIMHKFFKKNNIQYPNMYIPKGAEQFIGREIKQTTIGNINKNIPQFIKPIHTKQFPAQVTDPKFPLMTFIGQTFYDTMECYSSSIINFVSEYRCFLIEGKIIDSKHYLGDYRVALDWATVDACIEAIKWHPKGYCLDFGVTDKGQTLLIEANDGYSIGNYGLDPIDYAKLLQSRFKELINSKQE